MLSFPTLGWLSGLVVMLGLPGFTLAQENFILSSGSDGLKTLAIPRLDAEPRIDGVLDEEVWAQAALVSDLHQVDPIEFAEPTQKTEVRVFYTEDALYVSARMWETDPDLITARILRQGQGLQSDDIFALILDPFMDRRNGYRFEVNPNGVRWEGLFQNISDIQGNWDGIWQAGASRDDEGWTGEMRIPLQTISFNPDTESWGINFRRAIRRNNESIAWVSRNRQINPSTAGTATGINGLRQGLGLDVVPAFTIRQDRSFGPLGSTNQNYEPQLDVFYKITPQLNASLTINTDFSAAEVDARQVNLTRFNLFFPERRDFFIREADIFEFGQIGNDGGSPAVSNAEAQNARPFFSRNIGLSPRGAPVDINVGGKLAGRIGDWNVGSLLIRQGADVSSGVDATNIFVGRAVLNVLSESQLGVIATDGDPQSNLSNTLIGTDFRYRNSRLPGGRIVEGLAWYQQTDTEGKQGNNASYGFGISSPNNSEWRGAYSYKRVEENFDPAVGFVNQTGIESHSLDFGYRHFFPAGGYVRSLFGGFDGFRKETLDDGRVNSQNFGPRISINNNTGDAMFMRLIRNREVLQNDFVINRFSDGSGEVVIPKGDYSYTEGLVGIDIANQRKVSGGIRLRWGDFFNGNRFLRSADLTWRPIRNYSLGISYSENEIHLPAGNFTVRLSSINSQVAFSSTLSWSTLIQYDNVSETLGLNSRLNWIPEAGRQAFVVFNYGLTDLDKDNNFTSVSTDLSLKFNYTLRF
ncbi:MAG: carbohydrate binding family 9 domain-containing protein [Pseudomonadales bacterium]|nr:carbohydrate binding family 9 domain-containing protein [Pseudomonadales bacterium]